LPQPDAFVDYFTLNGLGKRHSFSIILPPLVSKMTAARHNAGPMIFTSKDSSSISSLYYEKGEFKRRVLSNTPQQMIENSPSTRE